MSQPRARQQRHLLLLSHCIAAIAFATVAGFFVIDGHPRWALVCAVLALLLAVVAVVTWRDSQRAGTRRK
ncbi:hypothetical protein GCM10027586_12590 [Kineococcus gypseus]|uniref:hypothetical protein n=1 Tax=Kineococcus gypseus TaxID=1637102 RepID=UPI003D7E4EC1